MGANWSMIPLIYSLDNYDLVNNSLVFCRIRGYILQTCAQCFRYILVLRCADRYALANNRVSIRALSRPQIAYRATVVIIGIWSVLSIQLLIWETIENGRCGVYGLFGQIFISYLTIFGAILPLLLVTILGILLMNNLHKLHTRIDAINSSHRLNKRETSLMRLVLAEVIVYIMCTFMFPIMQIYYQITTSTSMNKSNEQKQIESFLNFISQSLLSYLNYNTTFYIYIITSKSFRNEIKQIVVKCIQKLKKNTTTHETGLVPVGRRQTEQQPHIITVV
ncbi:hypothetical protein I4U23_016615 [Adineta vaga]|nr:hypothetical protein I4U23_016615 [Adineta vaga]